MDKSVGKPGAILLPHIGDIALQLLILLGRTTRPFRPADARKAVREALGARYNCSERAWGDRVRAAKDRLLKQGFIEVEDGRWRSTEAGRAEPEIIARIQAA